MKRLIASTLALALMAGSSGMAFAQPNGNDRHDDRGQQQGRQDDRHDDHGQQAQHHWQRGQRMEHSDWDRGQRIDYREHHFRRPPRGYEWREVDGQYVLAAVATGVIMSIILNAH